MSAALERVPRVVPDASEPIARSLSLYHGLLRNLPRDPVSLERQALLEKCLRITGSFEGSGWDACSGNFDGQGGSHGINQWCWGQGSFQPMLGEYLAVHQAAASQMIGADKVTELFRVLKLSKANQVAWAAKVLGNRENPEGIWANAFRRMVGSDAFIRYQIKFSQAIFQKALAQCSEWGLTTERGVAFMFDTCVQQGGVGPKSKPRIQRLLQEMADNLRPSRPLNQRERMECVTRGRTEDSVPRWQADVLSRRLAIIRGKSAPFSWHGTSYTGKVHGESVDIDAKFGLSDALWQ